MNLKSGWNADVKTYSDTALVKLISELRGSQFLDQQLEAQKELVHRLREKGFTIDQIIIQLTRGAAKATQAEIAKEWAEAVGITAREFKRMASGK